MAINRTGTNLDFPVSSTANTGTVSTTITVPADATLALCGVSAYSGGAGLTSVTLTKGGVDTPMTRLLAGVTDTSANWQCALFYMSLPDVGANKTLTWDWGGTGAIPDGRVLFSLTFWNGVDTANPVRDAKGAQGTFSPSQLVPALTVASGDMLVSWTGFFFGTGDGNGEVTSWQNLVELAQPTNSAVAEGSWGYGYLGGVDVYNPGPPNTNTPDDTGVSHRSVIPVAAAASAVRVTFRATGGFNVAHASIGIWSGATSTTTTVPVELKFGGASGFFIQFTTHEVTSDWVTLPAPVTTSDKLVVIIDHGISPSFSAWWNPGPAGTALYFKTATASYNSASDAGFTLGGTSSLVAKVVTSGGSVSSPLVAGVLTCTGSEGGTAVVSLAPAPAAGGGPGKFQHIGLTNLSIGL